MSDILSQSEIDALLSSLTPEEMHHASFEGDRDNPLGSSHAKKSNGHYELYDFRRADKLTKEKIKTLQLLHETFARLTGTNLSAYLRSLITLELTSIDQITYEEYLQSINESIFVLFSMPPLSNQCMLEMNFDTIFTIIDKLLGGPGKPLVRNVLTDIEEPLVRQISTQFLKNFKGAWESIININPAIDEVKNSNQFVQIVSSNDIILSILFDIHIGEVTGKISFCIPYATLKPIANKLSAQKWSVNKNKKRNIIHQSMITTHLSKLKLDCQVQLGTTQINVKDFLNLQAGDVLDLHQRIHLPLSFIVNDVPKFEGKPGSSGKKIAFHITNQVS